MRVLRVGMTYPRDIEPGVGQHAFYHAKCSKNEELIITSKRPGKIVENRPRVRVVEIEFENTDLGAYSDRGITRIKKLFKKLFGQIVFNLKACLAPHEAAGQAYNIAYGGREYLIDIYYGLTKALGIDVEPIFGPDRAGDIKHSIADICKAKEMSGYDPDWSFERGIEAAIEWYKNNL